MTAPRSAGQSRVVMAHSLATAMLSERMNVTNETRRLEDRKEATAR